MVGHREQLSDPRRLIALLHSLWAHVSRQRRLQLFGLAGLMLLGSIAELASLGMVLPFLGALAAPDRIFHHPWTQPLVRSLDVHNSQQLLLPLTVLFGLTAAISGMTRLALLWGQTRLGHAIGSDLGAAAYRRTLYQPYSVHAERNSSQLVSALMNKINTIVYFVIIPFLTIITSALIVFTIVLFMLFIDPVLTAISFGGFGLLYLVVANAFKRRVLRDSQQVTTGQTHVTRVVQEGLGGIRDVLIDGLQETYSRIYRNADNKLRRALANINIIAGAPRPIIEAFGLALIGWLAYLLFARAQGVASAIPVLGALALAAQRLLPLVQQGYSGWTSMVGGQASLQDVLVLLDQPLPAHSSLPPPIPIRFDSEITLRRLHFHYGVQGGDILRGIDLQICRGSRIGFVGATGSGKTTLLDVIMALLSPTSGLLCVDGEEVSAHNYRAWQARIAHVPQSIFLADTTIAENIAFGVPLDAIDWERVRAAAAKSQLTDTIESMPDSYETLVGERGMRLSGGQRQRIGIARALYKRADVLIFDEATSALDSETERAVMEAIESLDEYLTILIVAHRLSTLSKCDRIVELAAGKVLRIGTYEEIVGRSI